jgi:hypothetical protein
VSLSAGSDIGVDYIVVARPAQEQIATMFVHLG